MFNGCQKCCYIIIIQQMNSGNKDSQKAMTALLQHLQTSSSAITGFSISNKTRITGKIIYEYL